MAWVFSFLGLILLLMPMGVAAAAVAAAAWLLNGSSWPWFVWLTLSPLLYVAWLVAFLLISAATYGLTAGRHAKPRYGFLGSADQGDLHKSGLIWAYACYRRAGIVLSLPLVHGFIQTSRWLAVLVYRSYSPALHLGQRVSDFGYLYDPDLTHIGDDVSIGGRAAVSAHSWSVRKDGAQVYVSAPVVIGKRATIGGESRIALGCTIGEGAVVEPGSIVQPFTHIPPGEVWGGNPARFQRGREPAEEAAPLARHEAFAGEQEIRQLVSAALGLPIEREVSDLDLETCAAWDSLGQIAIASAIQDRYGVVIDGPDIFRLCSIADIVRALSPKSTAQQQEGLSGDPEMLPLWDAGAATRLLALEPERAPATAEPVRLVIASTFTVDPVVSTAKLWGRAFGLDLECVVAGYDQVMQALLDEGSHFATNTDGVNVVLTRVEDLPSQAALDLHLEALEQFAAAKPPGSQLLVGLLPPVVSTIVARPDGEELRARWRSRIEALAGVEPFDFAHVVEQVGIDSARSSSNEILMRAPYSLRLYQELAIALVRHMRASRRAPAKVIALDCDNTLWGGVLGEAGENGILLGPDGPGRAFQLFQQTVKELQARGFLLVVVTKNEERDVRRVFESHPEMILRSGDIAAWRINWSPKSLNLAELADELNLGLDSFVLLDDNPVERLEVTRALPEVHVVPLPSDPLAYCDVLHRLWLFDGATSTEEDHMRTRLMQDERRRHDMRAVARSIDDFLADLDLGVQVGHPSEADVARIAQLTQRTNQFNLSLKRRTEAQVRALREANAVLALRCSDKFGDYGLVGVCFLLPTEQAAVWHIDTLLMSCRILGRGIEDAFLHAIASTAAEGGARVLSAPFVAGPRNAQVTSFLTTRGFNEASGGVWNLPLNELPLLPRHVTLQTPRTLELASQHE